MKKNMGSVDKIIRLVLAAIFILLPLTETITGTIGIVLFSLAGIFVGTSAIGTCPLYLPFGINTMFKKKPSH